MTDRIFTFNVDDDRLDDFFLGPSNIDVEDGRFNDFTDHESTDSPCDRSISSMTSREMSGDISSESLTLHEHTMLVDSPVDLGSRLTDPIPFDGGSIAFGTIRLYDHYSELEDTTHTFIRGRTNHDRYPNVLIKQGLNKRWIRTDGLSVGTKSNISTLRIYVLPEDVDRSSRGSVKDFRRLIKYLLDYVDCSIEAWSGKADPHGPIQVYPEPSLEEEESLFYIFNTLRSPNPDLRTYNGDVYGSQAISDVLQNNITGLKTQLYPYQQRSVAAMVQREADPAKIGDLRKSKYLDIYGREFFFDLKEGSLCRHRPLYIEPQGGVLAETMGYGKTLICLALILATRGHYPKIPPCHADLTKAELRSKPATLLETAARRLKYEGLPWKNEFYNLTKAGYHYNRCIDELQKYERTYDAQQQRSTSLNPSRKGKPAYSSPIRLCSATLVIVPPNLIIQWRHEIERHIDKDALDLLVLDRPDLRVPSWQELARYDMVLISKARFEQEYRDDDLNQGRISRSDSRYRSPLTDVRWLRVICDEGHGFAGSSSKTNAMAMLDKMAIERRWVVSGTPASTVHGVEVGLAAVESTSPTRPTSREDELLLALRSGRSPESQKHEEKDFERLRLMVVNFLKLQPWANDKDDKADFRKYLAPRLSEHGKRQSIPALREVLQTLIVRHRIEDVDRDLTLPFLHNKVVYIEPCYYDKLTVNLFTMILITNYVTSEREDEDYMFHPRNRKKLSTLINNMAVGTFHWMGITEKDVRTTIEVGNKYLDEHIDKVSDLDGALLTEAILNGEKALADPGWRAFSTIHDIGTVVGQFPEEARAAWALDGQDSDPLLMGVTQAREVQRYVQSGMASNPGDPLCGIVGAGIKTMNAARAKANEYQKQDEIGQKDHSEQKELVGTKEEPKVRKSFANHLSVKAPSRRSSEKHPVLKSKASLHDSRQTEVQTIEGKVLGFSSAKLAYLAQRLLHTHPNEKTIIFYTNDNTAFFIAEALELLKITFRIYAGSLAVSKRAEYLAEFNSDKDLSVLLMDLKQAALGLHIAAASRVYIVNPIWNAALESQAIKRAHRIGQTREVYIETLVLAGTFEEAMVRRKAEKFDKSSSQTARDTTQEVGSQVSTANMNIPSENKDMLDDSGMVNVLKNIRFLKIKDDEERFARLAQSVPLFDMTPLKGAGNTLAGNKEPKKPEPRTPDTNEFRGFFGSLLLTGIAASALDNAKISSSAVDGEPQSSSIFGSQTKPEGVADSQLRPVQKRANNGVRDHDTMARSSAQGGFNPIDGPRHPKRARPETPSA